MSTYTNVKLQPEKIERLISALKKRGINPRSNAEAVNTIIDSFLLNKTNNEDLGE